MKEGIIFLSILFIFPVLLKAQICTGSLGDPVVNVTFGAGSSSARPLAGSITNYTYTMDFCPEDGQYAIVNATTNCFSSTWHNLLQDHTPDDVNGYMMVANGSFSPGDFYVDTVRGLCSSTTYEFAAWILNILKVSACGFNGIRPNLTFNIETTGGTILGTYSTGDIEQTPVSQWKQYGLFFTMPPGLNAVVLRLKNNSRGGCGNDIVLDDITFRPCGPLVNAAITVNAGGATTLDLCEGDTRAFSLAASVAGTYRKPAFQWQLSRDSITYSDIRGAVTETYVRNATGLGNFYYRLAVTEGDNLLIPSCRVFSNTLTIRMNVNPKTVVSANKPVCEEGKLLLSATGGSNYAWTGPDGFSATLPNPELTASTKSAGKYYVTVSTARGCRAYDSVSIQVFPKATVDAGPDQTICEGNTAVLSASASFSYLWSPSSGLSSVSTRNPVARPTDSTRYVVSIKDVNGCSSSDSVFVNVLKKPVAIVGPEVRLFEGQSASLNGAIRGTNVRYYWTPISFMTNSDSLSPTVSPKDNIVYTLHVESNSGCGSARSDVRVIVYKTVKVPNAFSPNGDGINDVWNIEGLPAYSDCNLTVFNRYGAEVFRSKGYNRKWDGTVNGKPLPAGTYYYTLDLKVGEPIMSGWVLIVR